VRSRARGREVVYRLEAAPLAELYGGWLARFLPVMEDSLDALKDRVEKR
jgi:hypothetical protein